MVLEQADGTGTQVIAMWGSLQGKDRGLLPPIGRQQSRLTRPQNMSSCMGHCPLSNRQTGLTSWTPSHLTQVLPTEVSVLLPQLVAQGGLHHSCCRDVALARLTAAPLLFPSHWMTSEMSGREVWERRGKGQQGCSKFLKHLLDGSMTSIQCSCHVKGKYLAGKKQSNSKSRLHWSGAALCSVTPIGTTCSTSCLLILKRTCWQSKQLKLEEDNTNPPVLAVSTQGLRLAKVTAQELDDCTPVSSWGMDVARCL